MGSELLLGHTAEEVDREPVRDRLCPVARNEIRPAEEPPATGGGEYFGRSLRKQQKFLLTERTNIPLF